MARGYGIACGTLKYGVLAVVLATGTGAAAASLDALGRAGYFIVGPTGEVERVIAGDAARVCAPDVEALPGNLTHYRPPADEIARSLSVDFCQAAVVDRRTVDAVLADADAMAFQVEARRLDGAVSQLAAAHAQPAPALRPPSDGGAFAEAYEALSGGDPEAAATLFVRGLERDPGDQSAHYYLGSAYEQMGRADYAAVQYRRVVRNWPNSPEAAAAQSALARIDDPAPVQVAEASEETDFFTDIARSISSIFETSPGEGGAPSPAAPAAAPISAPNSAAASGRFEQAEILYGDGARYVGGIQSDRPHGQGEMIYGDGSRYAGGFRDGLRHGQGRLVLTDGLVYDGQFVNDRIDGRGRLAWPDGSVYDGDFLQGARTGEGAYRWPSGSSYQGRFDDGVIVGPGVFVSSDGARYEGEFQDGRRTGRGVLTQPDGQRIEGEFVDGRLVRQN